jgi:hypothetical protein
MLFEDKKEYQILFKAETSFTLIPNFKKSFVRTSKAVIKENEAVNLFAIIKDQDGN